MRRVWAKKGVRPGCSSKRVYQWAYLYSFVRPSTGETVNFVGSTVNAAAMSAVLADFAGVAELGPGRRAVVVLDGAGWHRAKDLVVPEGVHLAFLPPYSPELQPAERIWPLINEVIANRTFPDLATLEARIDERCNHLQLHPESIHALCHYHWWPEDD